MKLEVGMYCRYKNFQNKIKIAKIKGIKKADEVFQYDYMTFDNDDGELETNIIKASFNIIDLIEVGDYVNGAKVNRFKKDYIVIHEIWSGREYLSNEEIKTIVTKEQFEQMSYKV